MPPLDTIRVKKLFAIAICLKVAASGAGWWLNDPWILGFCVPLVIMAAYVVLGVKRHESDVGDEKFADSCYYLGFIFTITSIIFSLFDLPQVGEKITVIAVRFGAAMVSTVIGLVVRIYLVSFQEDAADATRAAEESVIEAHAKLREQLVVALEKMNEFQSELDVSARGTVERVNIQVEGLARSYGRRLQEFFQQLAEDNRASSETASHETKAASLRLTGLIDKYASSLEATLARIDERIHGYSLAVTDRLNTGMAPEPYASRRSADARMGSSGTQSDCFDAVPMKANRASDTLVSTLRDLGSKPPAEDTRSGNVVELPVVPAAAAQRLQADIPKPDIRQLESMLAAIHASLARQCDVNLHLTVAVESVLKRDVEAAMRLSSLERTIGDAAGRLLTVVHALGEIARDVRAIGPAFDACQKDLSAVRDAISFEVKRGRARLGH